MKRIAVAVLSEVGIFACFVALLAFILTKAIP